MAGSAEPADPADRLAAVILAAGAGTRLRPLTDLRTKALCPVADRPLLDWAIDRVATAVPISPDSVAVNASHLAEQIVDHVSTRPARQRPTVRVEPTALGTAGALGGLRDWLAGRDVLVTNADAYLPGGLGRLLPGWDRERCRLLVQAAGSGDAGDFDGLRYVGACLLPWALVRELQPAPSGLYEVLWREQAEVGRLDFARLDPDATAIDCGTPADYLAANLHASGGVSVIGRHAKVAGAVLRSVVWDGAVVRPGEVLVDAIRAGDANAPVTLRPRESRSPE